MRTPLKEKDQCNSTILLLGISYTTMINIVKVTLEMMVRNRHTVTHLAVAKCLDSVGNICTIFALNYRTVSIEKCKHKEGRLTEIS